MLAFVLVGLTGGLGNGLICGPAEELTAKQPQLEVTSAEEPGTPGGPGLALLAAKALTCVFEGEQVIDNAVLLVRDGKIEALGSRGTIAIPADYVVVDVGSRWLAPGQVELHCHQGGVDFYSGGSADLNDMVYLTNPGLRASVTARTGEEHQLRALASGVTTVLFIPGSGTNIGGQGVTFKLGPDRWEEALIRDPGAMKLAQWGNPEQWMVGVGMSLENWNTRDTIARRIGYARRWEAAEAGEAPEPQEDIRYELFRDLLKDEMAVATHTQVYQVVLMTITMVARDFQLPVFPDHSTVGGWLTGELCVQYGVPAIVGPREIEPASRRMINGGRHGLKALRGLTIVPARAARIDSRVGSLEPGEDAEILVCTGYPVDPRVASDMVFVNGARVYDAARDGRIW